MNALQRTDSTWYVELSHTKPVTGPPDYGINYIADATVVIHNPDGSTENLVFDEYGAFRGVNHPTPGETYNITVDAPGMKSTEAQMTMPFAVPIFEVKWDSGTVAEQMSRPHFFYVNVPFAVSFNDPADVKNFYTVHIAEKIARTNQYPDGTIREDTIWRVREQIIEKDPAIATKDETVKFFADNTFAGQTYTAHFTQQFLITEGETRLEIRVLLFSLSEDYFKYMQTRSLQLDSGTDPFSQPVQVYSNVSSGFGIFAGGSIDSRSWKR